MDNVKLLKNYADALFKNASSENKIGEVFDQLQATIQLINSEKYISTALYSPIVDKSDKINLIVKLTETLNLDNIVKEFLLILIKNSRFTLLDKIVNYYEQFLDDNRNTKIVKVVSSKILEEDERATIKQYLETELINQKVEVKFEDDSSIIGGMLIQYDNNMLDLSIAGALKKIEDISKKALNI